MLEQELCQFIDQSPTAFHTVDNVCKELEQQGFERLYEKDIWSLEKGKKYYVTRNDSAVIAFTIPEQLVKGFHVFAAHSDSPAFKVKNAPLMKVEAQYNKLNVEKYGGMILATWLDRPLSIAGRISIKKNAIKKAKQNKYQIVSQKGEIVNVLINFDKDLCMIPNVAIHMNREMNQSLTYNAQIDMSPLVAMSSEEHGDFIINDKIAKLLDIESDDILGSELYLYNRQKSCIAGANEEFIMAPRLDDLECVFAGLKGIIEATSKDYINVLAVFNNEEVGSLTRQGADSTFYPDTLKNIVEGLGTDRFLPASDKKTPIQADRIVRCLVEESFMLSADNAHALHPNHPEKADPTNRPMLNKGVVLKFHGGQKYATDAYSEAMVRMLGEEGNIPIQEYYNRSDIAGGSTLGNIAMAQVSMPAADIGLPQLAMHSAYETAGTKDIAYIVDLAKVLYSR